MKKILKHAIPLAITLGFIYLVLRKVDLERLGESISVVDWWLLAPVVVIYLLGFLPRAAKWRLILAGVIRLSLSATLGYVFVGCAGNAVLPARLGELVRSYILSRREAVAASAVLSTIVLERVLELISLLILFSATIWLTGVAGVGRWALLGLAAAGAGLVLLLILHRHHAWLHGLAGRIPWAGVRQRAGLILEGFISGLEAVRRPGVLLLVVALGVGVYLVEGASYWLMAKAFAMDISYVQALFVLCFIFIGATIPSTAHNIGPLQYFAMLGLGFFGVDPNQALLYSICINAMLFVPALVGFGVLQRYGITLGRLRNEMAREPLTGAGES